MNNSNSHQPPSLSPAGVSRRTAMLADLQSEMKSFHQRRIRRQAGAVVCVLVLLAAWRLGPWNVQPEQPLPDHVVQLNSVDPPPVPRVSQLIKVVHNRVGLEKKYVVSRKAPLTEIKFDELDDEQLVHLLSETGKPSLLGRIDGQLHLIPVKEL